MFEYQKLIIYSWQGVEIILFCIVLFFIELCSFFSLRVSLGALLFFQFINSIRVLGIGWSSGRNGALFVLLFNLKHEQRHWRQSNIMFDTRIILLTQLVYRHVVYKDLSPLYVSSRGFSYPSLSNITSRAQRSVKTNVRQKYGHKTQTFD